MPKENIPPLPDHQDCEVLTGLTVDSVPRDGSLGRVRNYRKGGDVWIPDDRSDSIFFLHSGQVAVVSSDRDGRELVLGVIETGEPLVVAGIAVAGVFALGKLIEKVAGKSEENAEARTK